MIIDYSASKALIEVLGLKDELLEKGSPSAVSVIKYALELLKELEESEKKENDDSCDVADFLK